MRRVISLFLPRFATERIESAGPAHPPSPLALVVESGNRRVLHAVNRVAEGAGLRPGMALAHARALVPRLRTLPARPREDRRALAALAGWCCRYSPWAAVETPVAEANTGDPATLSLEQGGAAGLWLDVTGCAHLFGGEEAMLADLVERFGRRGLTARAAMADTPGCAWAVARYAPGRDGWCVVPPKGARAALAPLPVAALRLPAGDVAGLHGLGLRTIGDLYALPRAPLAARFGETVTRRLDAALGVMPEPISPALPEAVHSVRHAFAEPISRIEDIAAAIEMMCAGLCEGFARAGMGARRLWLALYRLDGTFVRLAVGTARASRDPAHLARMFAEHLDGIDPGFGIEDMVLAAAAVEPLGAAQLDLAHGEVQTGGVDVLIDRLANRLGAANVLRPCARESHLPERAAALAPAFEHAAEQRLARSPSLCPRPPRLLRPPESVEMIAEAGGPPALFRWRRATHRVARLEGPERIAPEWWRDDAAVTRDYYRVEDSEGRRFWLYREEDGPAWYLHGVFG